MIFGMPVAIFAMLVLVAVIVLLLLYGICTVSPHHPRYVDPHDAFEDSMPHRSGKERHNEHEWANRTHKVNG